MKITKDKLAKVIAEEVQTFLQEMKGPYAKMMRQQAAGDAYRSAMAQKSDEEDEEERARKEREFRRAHQAQKKPGEGLPDWMVEEEELSDMDDLLNRPASRRELMGDAVADVLEDALKGYLGEMNLDPGVLKNIMLDAEEQLLDVAIAVSQAVATHSNFEPQEMKESDKEPMRPRVDYGDTKSDKFDGPRTTTGRKFAKRVSNKKRRAQDKKATKED